MLCCAAPDGELPIVIGGQAVNLLAILFLNDEPELTKFSPFLSGDCDVLASANWLRTTAEKHTLSYKTFRAGQASPAVGWIRLPGGEKGEIELQVLRDVLGLTQKEVSNSAFDVMLDGKPVRVLTPMKLLEAKIANLLKIPQEGRHDLEHVQILIHCVRAALRKEIGLMDKGETTARNCINVLEGTVRLITSDDARSVAGKFGVDFTKAIPLAEIRAREEAPFRNFAEKRLGRLGF